MNTCNNNAIMPYNKNIKRPYPHPKVQFFRPRISDWQTWHQAHRWWSDIDVEDQIKQVVYYFKHMKERTRFRVIDANGKIISKEELIIMSQLWTEEQEEFFRKMLKQGAFRFKLNNVKFQIEIINEKI